MAGQRGGARPGAGRKKVADKNLTALEQARKKVIDKLPLIVDALIKCALEGDSKFAVLAGIHLLDRGMGKVTQALEHSGPGGGPVPFDLKDLSGGDLDALHRIARRMAGRKSGGGASGDRG